MRSSAVPTVRVNLGGMNKKFQIRALKKAATRTGKRDNKVIKLTATEYSLLALFARNEGKVLTHQFLLNQVWGPIHKNESQYLRVFIAQLRRKIEADPNRPAWAEGKSDTSTSYRRILLLVESGWSPPVKYCF